MDRIMVNELLGEIVHLASAAILCDDEHVVRQAIGDREQLWRLSQSWTPRQRKYAKDRFIRIHNLFAATFNP